MRDAGTMLAVALAVVAAALLLSKKGGSTGGKTGGIFVSPGNSSGWSGPNSEPDDIAGYGKSSGTIWNQSNSPDRLIAV